MELALETRGLRRTFGDVVAVDGIDLAVPKGSLYGFLGPNGAGKSTTIKCLTGLLRPSAGMMRILGIDPTADPVAVKRQVGGMPEDLALFDRLTGAETLSFVGQVYGLDKATERARSGELLDLMDLGRAADSLVAGYSHGMPKSLALVSHRPPEDPAAGLDRARLPCLPGRRPRPLFPLSGPRCARSGDPRRGRRMGPRDAGGTTRARPNHDADFPGGGLRRDAPGAAPTGGAGIDTEPLAGSPSADTAGLFLPLRGDGQFRGSVAGGPDAPHSPAPRWDPGRRAAPRRRPC